MKGFAPGLVLTPGHKRTRKWPIAARISCALDDLRALSQNYKQLEFLLKLVSVFFSSDNAHWKSKQKNPPD